MPEPTDRELLLILNDRSERLEKAVLGNGQPGLVDRVANLEGQSVSKRNVAAAGGGIGAVLMAGLQIIANKMGIGS